MIQVPAGLACRGAIWLLLAAAMVLTAAVFWPGLAGPFVLDDHLNLRQLGAEGGINSAADLLRYLMTGPAGPTGRPLSLLTFAANAQDWPADPFAFKLTNLLIHLVNGALVFLVVRRLVALLGGDARRAAATALLAATLWLLHPIQLTAVLYAVQRMTELSAMFVLAGVLVYLRGRELAVRRPLSGLVVMSLAVGVGGGLATLSKENGVLLPLFLLVLEATILSVVTAPSRPRHWRVWALVFLAAPTAYVVWYLIGAVDAGGYARRAFSGTERLLTQPRILFDYLGLILVPPLRPPMLMADGYVVSEGLWRPPVTALAMAGLAALLAAGWWLRRRQPVLAFAILWFLAGHVLESTSLSLELYFEHRNYLPLLGPALAVAWGIVVVGTRWRWAGIALAAGAVAATALPTWREAQVWRSEASLAAAWAQRHPESARAQQMLGRYHLDRGETIRTRQLMADAEERLPDHLGIELQLFQFRCAEGQVTGSSVEELMADARVSPYADSVFSSLDGLMRPAALGQCPPFDRSAMIRLLGTIAANPRYGGSQAQRKLYFHAAVLHAVVRNYEGALAAADRAFAAQANNNVAYNGALWAYQAGQRELALDWIQRWRAMAETRSRAVRWFFGEKKARNAARFEALEQRIHKMPREDS